MKFLGASPVIPIPFFFPRKKCILAENIYHMDYQPAPFDDSAVTLPRELDSLSEELARNVHEVWAAGRFRAGWKYGPVRDELKKEHPCLIPYEMLSEEEKDFDRATALSTIRFILSKGYRLTK